jgi:hypothetical protein
MTNPAPMGGNDPNVDPYAVDEAPPAVPPTPAYDSTELLESTPAFDSLAQETALTEPATEPATGQATEPATGPVTEPVAAPLLPPPPPLVESEYDTAVDYAATPSGPLAQVKAFATERPAVFLGVALATGWLVGKIFSSSDDD